MQAWYRVRQVSSPATVAAGLLGLIFGGTLAAFAVPQYVVSQKGREFRPTQLAIKQGDRVEIVNDDGDLLHHAYVTSEQFNFDSGDQAPGSRTSVTFQVKGTFNVLCAIHPKMKLVVRVD
jgi:plastocyanin